jgi:ankyrin repeat protein
VSQFLSLNEDFLAKLFDADFVARHQLLSGLFDLNTVIEGRTLLHVALEQEDLHLVTAMLRFGADPNLRSGHVNILPLGVALNQGRVDFVQILIAFGARFDYVKSELDDVSIQSEFLEGNYPFRVKALFSKS